MSDFQSQDPDNGWRWDSKEWNLLSGVPGDREGGFFSGGKGEKGLRWSTAGAGFTGDIHEQGLDIFAGGDTNVRALADFKKKSGDITLNSGGSPLLDLHGEGKGLDDYRLRLSTGLSLADNLQLTPGIGRDVVKGDADHYGFLGMRSGNTTGEARIGQDRFGLSSTTTDHGSSVTRSVGGEYGRYVENAVRLSQGEDSAAFTQRFGEGGRVGLDATHGFGGGRSLSGGVSQADDGTTALRLGGETPFLDGRVAGRFGTSFGGPGHDAYDLGVKYSDRANNLNLAFHEGGDQDRSLALQLKHAFGEEGSIAGALAFQQNKDGPAMRGSLEEIYGSQTLAQRVALSGTTGPDKNAYDANASITARLGSDLYAGAFGQFGVDRGRDNSYMAGGRLTYMPSDHIGLTAAAGYGSDGLEGRLQADFFKKGIGGARDLVERERNPSFSAFIGASSGGGNHLDRAFGAPDRNFDMGPTIRAGIGWDF